MAKKFYAVRIGRDGAGIYETWDKCRAQVHGVAGAIYKSFPTRQEAEAFIGGGEAVGTGGAQPDGGQGPFEGAVAYVDGSYDKLTGDFSCGAVLFYEGSELTFSERFTDPRLSSMHNVAGEIMGALTVIRYCLEHGIPALEIHHDYEGVAHWATGSWRANKPGTKDYAAQCRAASERIKLSFVKVKGHSGDKYNDMADSLAREALGL
ncbi:ribonuclease H family protein [Acutalibacter sp. 1XD8-36]|uniref:ribonuclease H family protein n=1 Tax=Acutalibacter sp. 1XD8-36 TaxID=2320852 RepID=UPI00261C7290|nr:ribonuclease H family protein [Acutalibacter sp. 1XD8-36]